MLGWEGKGKREHAGGEGEENGERGKDKDKDRDRGRERQRESMQGIVDPGPQLLPGQSEASDKGSSCQTL